MKKFNFLSKSSSRDCGHRVVTLASTVGSQEEFYVSGGNSRGAFTPADVCQTSSVRLNRFTAHRRGTMLKLLSVLVLVFVLGIGNVWGATYVMYPNNGSTFNSSWTRNTSRTARQTYQNITTYGLQLMGESSGNYGEVTSNSKFTGITAISVSATANGSKDLELYYSENGSSWIKLTKVSITKDQDKYNTYNYTLTDLPSSAIYIKLRASASSIYLYSITITTGAIKTLSSIAVSTAPTKTTYTEGEYFAPAGLVITRNYSDNTSDTYTYANHTSDFSFTPSTSTALTTGNNKVTITYGGKSVDQAITVNSAGGGGGSGNTYTLGWGSASGSAGTYTNFTATSGSVTSLLSFSTAQNNSQNPPAYNANDKELRLYYNSQGNGGSITITPATGITITGAVMTTSTTPSVKYTVDGGSATSVSCSNNTYTISGISAEQSLKIQNVNTSNTQLRIKTIAITYEVAEPEPATVVLKSSSCGGATFTVSESAGRDNYIVYTTNNSAEPDADGNIWSGKLYGNGDISISGLNKNTTYYYWVASEESSDYLYSDKANFTTVNGFDIELTTSDGNGNTTEATATSCITAGTSVTLTAHPTSGYKVSEWTVFDGNSVAISPTSSTATTFTFNMPSSNVMAEATYCALPTAPTGLVYTLNADETRGKTVLSWTAVAGATGYELSYSKDNVAQTPIDVNTNSYTFNPLAVGVYTWSVKAINGCGESAATNGTGFTICPDFSSVTPTVGAASSVLQTTATANWTAVEGAAKYTVQIFNGETMAVEYENVNATSKAITGLTANTTYVVKVIAYNACNEASLVGSSVAFTTLKNVYAVSFNANGGTGEIAAVNVTDGESTTLPSSGVTRAGYSLSGWKANNAGDLLAKGASYQVNAAVTMYAQWSANTITVTYKPNGPTADDVEEDFTYGDEYNTKAANTFSYSGYQFKHWNNAADGSGDVTLAAEEAYTGTEDITLYAIWDQLYTVNWIVNGKTKTTQTAIAGAALTTPYTPEVADCDNSKAFVGWTETQHYSNETEKPEDLFDYANTLTMPENGADYYAVFADEEPGTEDVHAQTTFSSKSWETDTEGDAAWTSGKAGNQLTTGRGVQVTTGVSGANATTDDSYNAVSSVVITYSTNANNSAGSIAIKVGTTDYTTTNNVTVTGGTTDRTTTFTPSGDAASGAVQMTVTCTTNSVYVKSVRINYTEDATVRTNYTTDCSTSLPTCEAPEFDVTEGEYTIVKNVTITTETEGATIYYTTDGSNPATSDTKLTYSSAVRVDHTLTLKAVAVKENYVNSTVTSADYTITLPQCATPTFSVAAGRYTETQSVVLSCETEGADIYYTIDGETPTIGSTKYTEAISVATNMTIKAVAIAENTTLSEVASATYKIVGPGSTLWELVESDASLQEGDIIILADKTNNKTAGAKHSSDGYLLPVTSVFSEDKSEITEVGETTAEFTLGGSAGNWTLTSASGTLGCGGTSNNSLNYTSNSKWAISITNGAASVTTSINTSTVYIKYNSGSPRFGSYTTTGTINVYRKTVICVDPETELAFASSVPTAIDASEKAQLATTGGNGNTVTYSVISNNANAASIDNQNKFSAVVAGTYTVQARQAVSNDFKCAQTTTIDIVVTVAATGVEVNKTELSLEEGQFETLVATVKPNDASNKAVTWSVTEGSAYVEVDANGKVTGKAVGSGVVQVKTEDGEFTATCAVTVTPPTPVLTLTATNPLAFGNVQLNETKDLTVNLKGSNLVADASYTITGDGAAFFSVVTALDNTTISSEDGQTLTIRFAPTAEGNKSAMITFSSGVASQTLTVTGIGKKRYTATLHAGNGSVTSETIQEATIGSGITLPEAKLSQKLQDGGWSFVGWSETELTNETAETPTTIAAGAYAIAADIDLYAVYTRSNIVEKTASKNSGLMASSTEADLETGKQIRWKCSSGNSFSDPLRLYKDESMTIKGKDNNVVIKSITFTDVSSYRVSNLTVSTGTLSGSTWTGSANSVIFTAGAQVRVSSIAVTYQTSEGLYTTYPAELLTVEYALNGGTGNFPSQTVVKGSSYSIEAVEPTKPNHDFLGWNDGSTTYQAAETIEDVQDNITLTAQWDEWAKATTITFKNGETTVDTKENIYKGASYTTPAAPNVDGKLFQGWSDGVNTYAAETEVTMPDDLTEDITITYNALWQDILPTPTAQEITDADLANGEWVLVTAQNQLKEGDVVIIAQAENTGSIYAMGDQHVDNAKCWRNQVSVAKSGNKITPTDEVAKLFVQVGYNSKYALYAINGTTGYLFDPQNGNNNYLNTGADLTIAASWNITIHANNIAEIINDASSKKLRYNSTNKDRFSCYSSDANVSLYKWVKKISGDMDISDVTLTDAVIVPEGQTLTVDEASTLDNIIIEQGGHLALNGDEDKKLTVHDMTINAMGGYSTTDGKSGQVAGTNVEVTGDLYLEIQLCSGDLDATKYYCISAPFEVNMNGGFFWGDGTPMVFNTHFQLFEYDGEKRANTGNGWQRVSGTMKANTAYFIVFDSNNTNQNTIRLKASNKTISNPGSIDLGTSYASDIDPKHSNWHGVANPTFHYIGLNQVVQIFDYVAQGFNPYTTETTSSETENVEYGYVVGTPIFVKSDAASLAISGAGEHLRAPQRQVERYNYCVRISKEGATRFDNQMYVVAAENATATYDEGKDVLTMNGETSNYGALIWTKNYGMRLAVEEAPMVNNKASYELGIFAPTAGTYSISVVAPQENAELYLTKNGHIIWNLTMSPCELELTQGQNEGYGLILRANAPSTATGVDEVQSDNVQCTKVVIDDHVYILRGGKMYGVDGKEVR